MEIENGTDVLSESTESMNDNAESVEDCDYPDISSWPSTSSFQKDPAYFGYKYWRKHLREAKLVVAPMVEQSELAWRLLCRRHGAELCYTPMFHANLFVKDATYRKENFQTCQEDRPLIVQFCANNPETLVAACNLVVGQCDGVDLNLGCPQTIAKRGFYGAFLQDHWKKIFDMVRAVHENVDIPISCKIRVFKDINKTVEYAKMLEKAGCQLLTVHGRTRDQKGPKTGLASWDHIKAVKKAVNIPVFANGNIQVHSDIEKCIQYTDVDGIMAAEGNLHNPGLFKDKTHSAWEMAEEYMELAEKYPPPFSYVRGHIFKIFHHSLHRCPDLRPLAGKARSLEELREVCRILREKFQQEHEQFLADPASVACNGLLLPHWICQPYYRPSSEAASSLEPVEIQQERAERRKRHHAELNAKSAETGLSKRRLRKLVRFDPLKFHERYRPTNYKSNRRTYVKCQCGNPMGGKCAQQMCRNCCKLASHEQWLNCESHNFWFANIAARRKQTETQDEVANGIAGEIN